MVLRFSLDLDLKNHA